jgi:protein involved in polysaccharide export with SLBB domain
MKTMATVLMFISALQLHAGVAEGDSVQITVRGIPAGEQEKLNGEYRVGGSGIRLPMLKKHLPVAGMDADQIAAAAERAYRDAGIYNEPAIDVKLLTGNIADERSTQVSVGGQVKKSGPVAYRKGMTLLEAIQAAGDRTEFGSRNMKLIRDGKVIILDFRKQEHKNFPIQPNDAIIVEQRGPLETDRG